MRRSGQRQEAKLLFGIPAKWIAIGATAIAVAFIIYVTLNAFEDRGALKERATVTNQNKEAGNAGENARLNLHECLARGLHYDFEAGKCGR